MEKKLADKFEVYKSDIIDCYDEDYVALFCVDAYSTFVGKSFCVENTVVLRKGVPVLIRVLRPGVAVVFQCVLRVFDSPLELRRHVCEVGENRFTEIHYSN